MSSTFDYELQTTAEVKGIEVVDEVEIMDPNWNDLSEKQKMNLELGLSINSPNKYDKHIQNHFDKDVNEG